MIYFFFFNDTATTEIYTLSLHDALPILLALLPGMALAQNSAAQPADPPQQVAQLRQQFEGLTPGQIEAAGRSEEHTSELQSRQYLVCRLLLEKKKTRLTHTSTTLSYSMS